MSTTALESPALSGGRRRISSMRDANRDPLRDLDPVAGRVLRRNDGELGTRRLADALDAAAPAAIGIGVEANVDGLPSRTCVKSVSLKFASIHMS